MPKPSAKGFFRRITYTRAGRVGSLLALELHVETVDERERDVLHERRVDLGDVERLLQGPDAELRDLGGALLMN